MEGRYMNFTQRRERFRAILAGDQIVRPAPIHDPISAWMAEPKSRQFFLKEYTRWPEWLT